MDNAEFFSTDYKKNVTLSKLTEAVGDDMPVRVWRFTIIDLDNDGSPEEFQAVDNQQNEKANAVWYEFTKANIKAYLVD